MTTTEYVCTGDGHFHGVDSVCYIQHGCRCTGCRAGRASSARQRRAEISAGTYARGRVDATPVREHLERLSEWGMGLRSVSDVTGISFSVLSGIRWAVQQHGKPTRRVSARYAARILAVVPTMHNVGARTLIPAVGTRRRIEALGCLGWSHAALARRLGWNERRVTYVAHQDRITAEKAREVAALYDQLWNTPAVATTAYAQDHIQRTLNRAADRGWAPPLAWDDIDADDAPLAGDSGSEIIDEIVVELSVAGKRPDVQLTIAERREALRQLHARHKDDQVIAAMLGVSDKTITRDREALGLPSPIGPDRRPVALKGLVA